MYACDRTELFISKQYHKVLDIRTLILLRKGFPRGGAPTPQGAPTYYLTNFSRKLHENEEILRVPRPLPSRRSANDSGDVGKRKTQSKLRAYREGECDGMCQRVTSCYCSSQ